MSIASPPSRHFYTLPDTITKEVNEYCDAKPPPGGGVCTGNYDCTIVDGYPYDKTEKTSSPCDNNQFPTCKPGPVEVSNCDTLKKGTFINNVRTKGVGAGWKYCQFFLEENTDSGIMKCGCG